MSEKTRVPLSEAEAIAETIVETLSPVCERIEIAGSIRRRKKDVADVEIVCIPRMRADGLFGDGSIDQLRQLCDGLLASGRMAHRRDVNGRRSYGDKFKRLLFDGLPLDLFSVLDPNQWGVILAIRTGPAEYSHKFVTPVVQGGSMPKGMRVEGGWLWRGGSPVNCPEESDFFREIGVVHIEPAKR